MNPDHQTDDAPKQRFIRIGPFRYTPAGLIIRIILATIIGGGGYWLVDRLVLAPPPPPDIGNMEAFLEWEEKRLDLCTRLKLAIIPEKADALAVEIREMTTGYEIDRLDGFLDEKELKFESGPSPMRAIVSIGKHRFFTQYVIEGTDRYEQIESVGTEKCVRVIGRVTSPVDGGPGDTPPCDKDLNLKLESIYPCY
jgi:hypothetical protein